MHVNISLTTNLGSFAVFDRVIVGQILAVSALFEAEVVFSRLEPEHCQHVETDTNKERKFVDGAETEKAGDELTNVGDEGDWANDE